jgi:hypothetical protein
VRPSVIDILLKTSAAGLREKMLKLGYDISDVEQSAAARELAPPPDLEPSTPTLVARRLARFQRSVKAEQSKGASSF